MDSVWMMSAGNVLQNQDAMTGLAIGIAAGVILCSIAGVAGIFLVKYSDSAGLAVLLQLPLLAVGIILVPVGLALLLGQAEPAVALALLGGGGIAIIDSSAFVLTIKVAERRKRAGKTSRLRWPSWRT